MKIKVRFVKCTRTNENPVYCYDKYSKGNIRDLPGRGKLRDRVRR